MRQAEDLLSIPDRTRRRVGGSDLPNAPPTRTLTPCTRPAIGFPPSNSTTRVDVLEAAEAAEAGATEIDMVVNIGKVLGDGAFHDWIVPL